MRKITCLIVDDEPLALNVIEGYVGKTPFLELAGRCKNAFEALEILSRQEIDLVFLDIQMPDLSGIALSKTLKQGTKVVFTTAFEEYALEGFKVDAVDYLLKPFNYEEFLVAANRVRDWFQLVQGQKEHGDPDPGYIFVKSDYKQVKVNLDDVHFFESLKDYVKINMGKQVKPVLSLVSLKSVEDQLPPNRYMRVHRSFIVNLNKIESIERGQIVIEGTRITIGEQYKDKFQQYLTSKSINHT